MQNTLSLYQAFYETAREGSISRAAEKLYISQPAVSRDIKRLEETLKVTLFRRTSKGVLPTEEGALLFTHIEQAFLAIEGGEKAIALSAAHGVSHLRIGASTTLCKYLLLNRLKAYRQKYPNVRITITCQSTYQTVELLRQKKIDIGLIGKTPALGTLLFHPVMEIQDAFVTTQEYIDTLRAREGSDHILTKGTFMMLDKQNITRQYVGDYLRKSSLRIENVLEITTMDLLIEFAKIGLGIACVIKQFVQEDLKSGSLIEVPVGITIPGREIGFACEKSIALLPQVKSFLEM